MAREVQCLAGDNDAILQALSLRHLQRQGCQQLNPSSYSCSCTLTGDHGGTLSVWAGCRAATRMSWNPGQRAAGGLAETAATSAQQVSQFVRKLRKQQPTIAMLPWELHL